MKIQSSILPPPTATARAFGLSRSSRHPSPDLPASLRFVERPSARLNARRWQGRRSSP